MKKTSSDKSAINELQFQLTDIITLSLANDYNHLAL